jgi:hypothetical protein
MKAKRPLIIFILVFVLFAMAKSPDVGALTIKVGYPQLSGGSMRQRLRSSSTFLLSNFPILTTPSPPAGHCSGRIQICLEVF